jgi:competence protein ComEC
MMLFAAGWSDSLAQYAGWVFDHLLWLLDTVVFWVEALPHATSRNITMTGFESSIIFITIGLLCWFVAEKRFRILLMTLLCVLLLSTSFAIDSIHKDQRNQLIVYSVTGKKAIALISGRRVFFDFDSSLVNNPLMMRYNVNEHWSYCGIEEKISLTSLQENNESPGPHIYTVRGRRIAVIDGVNLPLSVKANVDVLILSGNPKLDLEEASKNIACKKLVFDTSNKPARMKKWLEQCLELHIDYHDCRERAFIMDL